MNEKEQELFNKQKELTRYYQNISEIHLAELEDLQKPVEKILIAKGILIEIESDLIVFLKKSKPTDKSQRQQQRITALNDVIDYFDKIASTNYQMKLMLRQANRKLAKERSDHEDTLRALDMATNILNEG